MNTRDIAFCEPIVTRFYKGFYLSKESGGWSFRHMDYDLTDPDDNRYGFCATPTQCYDEIDFEQDNAA